MAARSNLHKVFRKRSDKPLPKTESLAQLETQLGDALRATSLKFARRLCHIGWRALRALFSRRGSYRPTYTYTHTHTHTHTHTLYKLSLFSETTYSFAAVCKTFGTFYVDEHQIDDNSITIYKNYGLARKEFDTIPKLIAIECKRRSDNYGYVLASISSAFVSNETWRCVPQNRVSSEHWMRLAYDDYWWPAAVDVDINTNWPMIERDAEKLWYTRANREGDRTAYCRGTAGQSMLLSLYSDCWVPELLFGPFI